MAPNWFMLISVGAVGKADAVSVRIDDDPEFEWFLSLL